MSECQDLKEEFESAAEIYEETLSASMDCYRDYARWRDEASAIFHAIHSRDWGGDEQELHDLIQLWLDAIDEVDEIAIGLEGLNAEETRLAEDMYAKYEEYRECQNNCDHLEGGEPLEGIDDEPPVEPSPFDYDWPGDYEYPPKIIWA